MGTAVGQTGTEESPCTDPVMLTLRAVDSIAVLSKPDRVRLAWLAEALAWPLAMVTDPVRVVGEVVTPAGKAMV